MRERGGGCGGWGVGVGTGKGTGASRTRLSKRPFSKLPFSFSPKTSNCEGGAKKPTWFTLRLPNQQEGGESWSVKQSWRTSAHAGGD